MIVQNRRILHDCEEHDLKFPDSLMCCNPKSALCSDCPFSRETLMKRYLKIYGESLGRYIK